MVIADDAGKYLDVNQAASDLFGYSREQMLSMSVGDLMTLQAPGAAEQYRNYLRTGRETGEFTFVRADGGVRVASYSAYRLAPGEHFSILRDVTVQKQNEKNVLREKNFTVTALDSLPGIFYVFDTQGRFLRWNNNFERVSGYSSEEIAEMHPIQFFVGDDKALIAERIQAVFENGEAVAEADFVSKEGTKTPYFFTGKLTRFDDKLCLVGMGVDVSERARTEAALRKSEERYRSLTVATTQIVWMTDASGVIVQPEDSWADFTGQTLQEYLGWGWLDAIHPDDRERTRAIWKEAVHSRQGYETEYRLRFRDGTYRSTAVRGVPIMDEQGDVREWIGTNTDITERVQHLKEIETLNDRLRRLVQETHHRVKNNLQIISALVEMQMEEREETVPITALIRIGQHTRSLAAVHDLLTHDAKINADKETISTKTALNRLIPLLQATTGGRPIQHRVDEVCLSIQQTGSLCLLINELVANAVKHGRGKIELAFTVEEDAARLEVCDDGPGFPPDFDWRKATTIGMGLIDSTGRYDLRGTISYENRLEGGARVVVVFPLFRPESHDI